MQNLNQTIATFKVTAEKPTTYLPIMNLKMHALLNNTNQTMVSAKNTLDKFGNVAEELILKNSTFPIEKLSITIDKLNAVISGIEKEGTLGKFAKDETLTTILQKHRILLTNSS